MSDQDFAATISQTAQDVFRQPSVPFSPTQVFRDIPGFDSILAIQYILAIETALDITLNEALFDTPVTQSTTRDRRKSRKTGTT